VEFELSGARLRHWRRGDEASLVQHANNRNVWRNLRDMFPHPYTLAHAEEWLQRQAGQPESLDFAIEVDGQACGGIGLHPQTDVARRSAEIGYWLGEAYWGRGIVSEAVKAVSAYGLAAPHLDLVRIYAHVFAWNPASMRVLEKAGFVREAVIRRAVTKDGETIDEVLYALVKDE
jgi:ribosomal-protein-alanine N-acetyltransferase